MYLAGYRVEEVSSWPNTSFGLERLTDGNESTYWESSASNSDPHWIRLRKDKQTKIIRCIQIEYPRLIDGFGSSYLPCDVEVHAGSDTDSLTKVGSTNLRQHIEAIEEGKTSDHALPPITIFEAAEPRDNANCWNVIEIRINSCGKEEDPENDCRVGSLRIRSEPPSSFRSDIGTLWEDRDCEDVVFSVDGTEIRAHRCILCARSPVFRALLAGHFAEGLQKDRKVIIADVEPIVFEQLLRFLYVDDLDPVPHKDCKMDALFVAADKYQITRLAGLCEQHFIENLSTENCCQNLILAEAIGALDLKQAAMEHVVKNCAEFKKIGALQPLAEKYPDLMVQLFFAATVGFDDAVNTDV